MTENPSKARGAEIQQKFHFYVVGLTFGVLALSIQTASFAAPIPARLAELLGWVLLLVSGLIGLSRIEWIPKQYELIGAHDETESRTREFQKIKLQGAETVHTFERRSHSIDELITQAKADSTKVKEFLTKVNHRANLKYTAQKITFLLGLVALMIASGWSPVLSIVSEIRS